MSEEEKQFSPTGSEYSIVSSLLSWVSSPSSASQFPSFAPAPPLPSPTPATLAAIQAVATMSTNHATNVNSAVPDPNAVANNVPGGGNNTVPPIPAAAHPSQQVTPPMSPSAQGQQQALQDQLDAQAVCLHQLNENVSKLFLFIQQQQQQMQQQQTNPNAVAPSPNAYANVTLNRGSGQYQGRQSTASTMPMYSPGLNFSQTPSTPAVNPLKHAKIEAPEKFHGKPGTTAAELNLWLTSMEIYMKALALDDSSEASLDLAMTRLTGGALNLVVNLNTIEDKEIEARARTGRTLVDWKSMKAFLKKEYVAESQVQISRNKLMAQLKYTGSIVKYNGEFYNELVQVPEFNDPVNKDLVMNLYANGISSGHGPYIHVFSRRIQTAMQNKEVKSLNDLMNMMKVTENNEQILDAGRSANRGRSGDRNGAARASAYSRGYTGNSSGGSGGNNRSTGNWRTPARAPATPGFQTPARVNNIEAEDEQKYVSGNGVDDDERENGDAPVDGDSRDGTGSDAENAPGRDDDDGYADGGGDATSDDVFLHAIKIYDRMKKEQPNLTPEELDRRRRAGTCFRCNQTGHYSRDCPQAKKGTGPNAFKYMGQKK